MRRRVVLLVVVAAAALAVGAADAVTVGVRGGDHRRAAVVAPPPPTALTIRGEVVLGSAYGGQRTDWAETTGGGCQGAGAFAVVTGGVAVQVLDGRTGAALGASRLQAGRVTAGGSPTCAFALSLPAVPIRGSYAIGVAGLQQVQKSYAELSHGPLEIDATAS